MTRRQIQDQCIKLSIFLLISRKQLVSMINKNVFQQQNYEVIANKINKNIQDLFEKIIFIFLFFYRRTLKKTRVSGETIVESLSDTAGTDNWSVDDKSVLRHEILKEKINVNLKHVTENFNI